MARTKAPITTSGWYEHEDGTVGEYVWVQGQIREADARSREEIR